MATLDWPTSRAFEPASVQLSVRVSESAYLGAYSGVMQRRSNLVDRWQCIVLLPPCKHRSQAAEREAFFMGIRSTGDWIRFGLPHRRAPLGTARGTLVAASSAVAGARSLSVSGASPSNGTLLAGDFLSVSNHLLQVGYPGMTFSGGTGTVPLSLPLPVAVGVSTAIAWLNPVGTWQLDDEGLQVNYSAGVVQGGLAVPLLQVV